MPNDRPSMVTQDSPANTPFVLQKGNDPLSARVASVRGLFSPALTYTNTHEVATRPKNARQVEASRALERVHNARKTPKCRGGVHVSDFLKQPGGPAANTRMERCC